jgi:hypothetical protein
MYTQLSNHRSKIKGWESMKTLIWGKHRWDFFRIINDQKETPIEILTPYFTKNNAVIPKKKQEEIKEYYKFIEKMTWFPLDRLYLKALYENSITGEKIDLDLSKKEHREKFLEKSKVTPAEFFRWVLYVMDWEKLESLDDILSNFFTLQSKFQSFISSDTNHEIFKNLFNEEVAKLDEHNIESIVHLNEKTYYDFITHPKVVECSPKNALKKLFFLINNSDFLKGVGPLQHWKPSFEKFTGKIEDIFNGKYSKNHKDANRFRRLKENEIRLYDNDEGKSYIDPTNFIPDDIKLKYAFRGWEVDIIKPVRITTDEIKKYFSMRRAASDRIKEMAEVLKIQYRERNTHRKDLDVFTEQTIKATKKRKKERDEAPKDERTWKDIYDENKDSKKV